MLRFYFLYSICLSNIWYIYQYTRDIQRRMSKGRNRIKVLESYLFSVQYMFTTFLSFEFLPARYRNLVSRRTPSRQRAIHKVLTEKLDCQTLLAEETPDQPISSTDARGRLLICSVLRRETITTSRLRPNF